MENQCSPALVCGNSTITNRLEGQKADLENRLEKVNKALEALKRNPELQEIFDLVSKVGW